jgi:HSP20 family molecular chaperone IbpA
VTGSIQGETAMAKELTIKEANKPAENEQIRPGRTYVPGVDIRETDDSLWLWVDVPGVDEKSIDVRLEDGKLHIEGRVAVDDYQRLRPLYTEYNVGDFVRTFRIDNEIDAERISAKLSNGVLQLELPKARRALPRRVQVVAA